MNNYLEKIIIFIKTYKWLLLLAIPVFIFLLFLFLLVSTPRSTQNSNNTLVTPTPNLTLNPKNESASDDFEQDIDSYENLINKEPLSDGSTKYSFASGNPERPDITVLTKDNKMLFYRRVSIDALPIISPSLILETFGQPEKTIQGSTFYGKDAAIFLYAKSGVAFIVNPKTNETYEEQRFQNMSIDEYLKQYGNQN